MSGGRAPTRTFIDLADHLSAGGDVAGAYSRALARLNARGGTIYFSPRPDGEPWDLQGDPLIPRSGLRLLGHGVKGASQITSSVDMSAGSALIGQPTEDVSGFSVEGLTLAGNATDPALATVTIDGRTIPMPRRASRAQSAGPQVGISLQGDLVPTSSSPVVEDVTVRGCWFDDFMSLPMLLKGLRGVTETTGLHSYNTLDFGWTFCEHVISGGNSSRLSGDNGFSYSRGNQRMSLGHHLVYCCAYGGLWIAGFSNDDGPTDFLAGPFVVKVAGRYGVDMHFGPKGGEVWMYVTDVYRGTTEDIASSSPYVDLAGVGVVVTGNPDSATPTKYAEDITIRGKLKYCQRGGVLVRGAKNITIDAEIVDPGTQYLADGTTLVSSLPDSAGTYLNQRQQNFGVRADTNYGPVDYMRVRNLDVRDDRGTPWAIYPLVVPVEATNCRIGTVTAAGTLKTAYEGVKQNAGATNVWSGTEAGKRVDSGTVSSGWTAEVLLDETQWVETITATGGTRTFSFGGQTTAALAYNASGTTIQSALTDLSSIGASNAVVSVSGSTVTIQIFVAGTLTVNGAGLTGGTSTLGVPYHVVSRYREVTVTFPGGAFASAPAVYPVLDIGAAGASAGVQAVSTTNCVIRLTWTRPRTIPNTTSIHWKAVGA